MILLFDFSGAIIYLNKTNKMTEELSLSTGISQPFKFCSSKILNIIFVRRIKCIKNQKSL